MSFSNVIVSSILKKILTALAGSMLDIMQTCVAAYQSAEGLTGEEKRIRVIDTFKRELVKEGKEMSNNMINFLLESCVLLMDLSKK